MKFNTSGPLNPLLHKDNIVERNELYNCLSIIKNSDEFVSIFGPRQFGKTTMLYQLQNILVPDRLGVAYIDFENMANFDISKFYKTTSNLVWDQMKDLLETDSRKYGIQKVTDQSSFIELLIYFANHTPKLHKLIFLFDEIGGIPYDIAWNSFLPTLRLIFNTGRGNGKNNVPYSKLRFVFAGTTDLIKYVGHNSPINNVCERIDLKEFSHEQVLDLTQNLSTFNESEKRIIAECIFYWCSGHPYITQRILAALEESHSKKGIRDLNKHINKLIEEKFIYGNDKNTTHIIKTLEANPGYKEALTPVYKAGSKLKDIDCREELTVLGFIETDPITNYLKPRNAIYKRRIRLLLGLSESSQITETYAANIFYKSVIFIFDTIPISIGKFLIEIIIRKDNPSTISSRILGWLIIIGVVLLALKILTPDLIISFYRFFYPEPK